MRFGGALIFGLGQIGALAYVDRLVRRIINGRNVEILYISAIQGDFVTHELIYNTNAKDLTTSPTIVGSLTDIIVINGSQHFIVGDMVNVTSNTGVLATARVANTYQSTGLVQFDLIDGGWGFSSNAVAYVSSALMDLTVTNRSVSTYLTTEYLEFRQNLIQPLANISYYGATGIFNIGDMIYNYTAGVVSGQGQIISTYNSSSTNGYIYVSVLSGNLQSNNVYHNQGNAISANLVTYTNLTKGGLILNIPNDFDIFVDTSVGTFQKGEQVYQVSGGIEVSNGYISSYPNFATNGTLTIANASMLFFTNTLVQGRTSGAYANLNSINLSIGLQTNSTFDYSFLNYVYCNTLFSGGFAVSAQTGVGANLSVGNTFAFSETLTLNSDFIINYLTTNLAAVDYGVNLHYANLTHLPISSALNYLTANIGKIEFLSGVNPGNGYSFNPVVSIVDPLIAPYHLHDFILTLSTTTGIFTVGEVVQQATTSAIGIVQFANTSTLYVQRLSFEDRWSNNLTYQVQGVSSGYTAYISQVAYNTLTLPIGVNANVETTSINVVGGISKLQVISSGYGFNLSNKVGTQYQDLVTITSEDGARTGLGFVLRISGERGSLRCFHAFNRSWVGRHDRRIAFGKIVGNSSWRLRNRDRESR